MFKTSTENHAKWTVLGVPKTLQVKKIIAPQMANISQQDVQNASEISDLTC